MKNKKSLLMLLFSVVIAIFCTLSCGAIITTNNSSSVALQAENNQQECVKRYTGDESAPWKFYNSIESAVQDCKAVDIIVVSKDCYINNAISITKNITIISDSNATVYVSSSYIKANENVTSSSVFFVSGTGTLNLGSDDAEFNGANITKITFNGNQSAGNIFRFITVMGPGVLNIRGDVEICNFLIMYRSKAPVIPGAIIYTDSTTIEGVDIPGQANLYSGVIKNNNTSFIYESANGRETGAYLLESKGLIVLSNNVVIENNICNSIINNAKQLKINDGAVIQKNTCNIVVQCYMSYQIEITGGKIINNTVNSKTLYLGNERVKDLSSVPVVAKITGGEISNNATYEICYSDVFYNSKGSNAYGDCLEIGGSLKVKDICLEITESDNKQVSLKVISPLTEANIINVNITTPGRYTTKDGKNFVISFAEGVPVDLSKLYCNLEDYAFIMGEKNQQNVYLTKIAAADKKTVTYNLDETNKITHTYKQGDQLCLPFASKDGSKFIGWYTTKILEEADLYTNKAYAQYVTDSTGEYLRSVADDNVQTIPVMGSESMELFAGFESFKFDVTVTAGTNGQVLYKNGEVDGSDMAVTSNKVIKIAYGQNPKFVFEPNEGYHVSKITIDQVEYTARPDEAAEGSNEHLYELFERYVSEGYTILDIQEEHAIAVEFDINIYEVKLAYDSAFGTVTHNASHDEQPAESTQEGTMVTLTTKKQHGAQISFTLAAIEHYHVDSIAINGANMSAEDLALAIANGLTVNPITGDTNILVLFIIDTYTIEASVESIGGSISPSGSSKVNYGDSAFYVISADLGYHVSKIEVNSTNVYFYAEDASQPDKGRKTSYEYIFEEVLTDGYIKVWFEINSYEITASMQSAGGCSVAPTGVIEKNFGESVAFTFTITEGYHIDQIIFDDEPIADVNQEVLLSSGYTISDISDDHTIEFVFKINLYSIKVNINGDGKVDSDYDLAKVEWGSTVNFKVLFGKNSFISEVLIDGKPIDTKPEEFTFENVIENHTVEITISNVPFFVTKEGIIVLASIGGLALLIGLIVVLVKVINNKRLKSELSGSMSKYKEKYGKYNEMDTLANQSATSAPPQPTVQKEQTAKTQTDFDINEILKKSGASQMPSSKNETSGDGNGDEWLKDLLKKADEAKKNKPKE